MDQIEHRAVPIYMAYRHKPSRSRLEVSARQKPEDFCLLFLLSPVSGFRLNIYILNIAI
jgi:hypothetical protein